jgi:hypothetical protein
VYSTRFAAADLVFLWPTAVAAQRVTLIHR